jgi:hypothetical protein
MSIEALEGAIADCLATLKSADALDRENGTNNGGYYRDVISVYRAAIAVKKREAGDAFYCVRG